MSFFRTPSYIDLETLIALAHNYDIEVAPDTEVTARERGQKSKGGKAGAGIGSLYAGFGGDSETESEVIQKQLIKAHPTKILNQVVNQLQRDEDLTNDINSVLSKGKIVELEEEDWIISPATDAGNFFSKMLEPLKANPSLANSDDVPNEVIASAMISDLTSGPILLEREEPSEEDPNVIVMLNAENILNDYSPEDLEGNLSIFGTVERIVGEGRTFSLERFYLAGLNRALRRSIDIKQLMKDSPMEISSLEIPGPITVIRAIAIY